MRKAPKAPIFMCPLGQHLIFTYPSGRIVPHIGNDGLKCPASYKLYAKAELDSKKDKG